MIRYQPILCSMLNPIVTLVSELKVFCLTFSNLCSMIIVLILLTDVSIVLKMLQFCQVVFGREFFLLFLFTVVQKTELWTLNNYVLLIKNHKIAWAYVLQNFLRTTDKQFWWKFSVFWTFRFEETRCLGKSTMISVI